MSFFGNGIGSTAYRLTKALPKIPWFVHTDRNVAVSQPTNSTAFAYPVRQYCSIPTAEGQENPRVTSAKTPNPLSRKFQGPKFLEENQVIEVRSEKEAFSCSTILHDLYIASKLFQYKEPCCSSQKHTSEDDSMVEQSNGSCCQSKGNKSGSDNMDHVADIPASPLRSIYLNEKTLTITLRDEYLQALIKSAAAPQHQDIEATADKIWEKLTPTLLNVMEKGIDYTGNSVDSSFTGIIKVLDKCHGDEPISMNSLWATAGEDTEIDYDDSEPVMAVKELIKQRVKPLLEQDGGSCRFVGMVEEGDTIYAELLKHSNHVLSKDTDDPLAESRLDIGSVLVLLEGACVGCPSSSFTLKNGIQRMLTHWVPEVSQVVEVDEAFSKDVLLARKTMKERKNKE